MHFVMLTAYRAERLPMSSDIPSDFGSFPATDWSLVGHASRPDEQSWMASLNELLSRYRPALKAHLVLKKRFPPAEADDLVQGFLSAKVLDGFVSRADREKGKFRTILLTALDNYVISVIRRDGAKKRSPEQGFVTLDNSTKDCGAVQPPPDPFDLAWANQIISLALQRVKDECTASGRASYWSVFEGRVVTPISEGTEPLSYEQIVKEFGFRSPTEASNALVTAKRMFVRALRAVVAEYAGNEEAVDKEIDDLRAILSHANGD